VSVATAATAGLTSRFPDPPLDPSGAEARAKLRRELVRPEYHEENLLREVVNWLIRKVNSGIDQAQQAPPLSTLATMVIFLGLVVALIWLVSRARLTARERDDRGAVLTEEIVTADELRARADAAFEAGRFEEAVVEAFRAIAVRQVERGRLTDAPGATAHEVADVLATEYGAMADRVQASASLFDAVLYGDRPADREQARSILTLDDDLVVRR
jgi:hypothetical protein